MDDSKILFWGGGEPITCICAPWLVRERNETEIKHEWRADGTASARDDEKIVSVSVP